MKTWVFIVTLLFTFSASLLTSLNYAQSAAVQSSIHQKSPLKKHFISERWSTENGLPINHVNQVYQTPNGFLWLATFNGLVRFDGVSFKEFNSGNTPSLPSNRIVAIQPGLGNSFWINTEQNHLLYFSEGIFSSFEEQIQYSSDVIVKVDGNLNWIGTNNGLYLFNGEKLKAFKPELFGEKSISAIFKSSGHLFHIYDFDGQEWLIDLNLEVVGTRDTNMEFGPITVTEDKLGRIWIARNEISFLNLENDTYTQVTIPQKYSESWDRNLHMFINLATSPDGRILVMGQSGLMQIEDAKLTAIDFINYNGYVSFAEALGNKFTTCSDSTVWTIFQDQIYRNGAFAFKAEYTGQTIFCDNEQNLWVTTTGDGLYRYRESIFENIIFDHSENIFYGIYKDSYGITWIGSYYKDLIQIEESGQSIEMKLLPGYGLTTTFLETTDGSLWNGYNRCRPENRTASGTCISFEMMPGFEGLSVYAMHQDRNERIWVGTEKYLLRWTEGNFEEKLLEKIQIPFVRYILETEDHSLWMATNGEGVFNYRDGTLIQYTADEGLSSNNIRSLYEDDNGFIWIASEDRGLNRLNPESGEVVVIRKSDGLFEDGLHKMLMDNFGRMWISTNQGIFWVDFNHLHEFASGERSQIHSTSYNEHDGMLSREANGGFQNTGYKSDDGRLFFATQRGIVVVDPDKIDVSYPMPGVVIEDLFSSGNSFFTNSGISTLDPEQRNFTIRYNSPFFLAPDRVRFRYKLEGFDKSWNEAGSRREAIFTNIPAGTYTFKVSADLGNYESEPHISSYDIIISPFFYETAWFPISILLLFFLLFGGGYQLRWRHLLRKEKILEKLVQKRTEDLRSEKLKTEVQANQLRRLNQEKNRFFANISHEFRTPLTLTIGPLTDLKEGKYGDLTPEVHQQVELSLRNSRRVLRLVGQLMDLARLEDKKFELNLKSGNLCRYLLSVAEPFKTAANQKLINFNVLIPQTPLIIKFDPQQFDKIIANLLSNAFKFTPEKGTISLQLTVESDEAIITVSDTGPGIEPEHLPRLFDRFYQIQKSEMQPGSGIGLSIAKELAELHGNKIEVKSSLVEGSTFTIRIPLISESNMAEIPESKEALMTDTSQTLSEETVQSVRAVTTNSEDHKESLKKILIVDDHSEIRSYLKRNLREKYNIIEAASGNEALSIIKKHLPDLIISDIMMPNGDGFTLLKQIRNNSETSFLPVILLTARAEADDKLSGLDIGANDYISKPFNMKEVLVRIKNLFEQQIQLKLHLTNGKYLDSQFHHDPVTKDSTDQIFLNAVKKAIQSELSDENFSVEDLAAKVNQSRSNLHRRLTKLTGETPSAMIRRIRLELGAQLLQQNAGTVSEIAYSIGFKNVAHFSRVFREHFNQSPTEYAASPNQVEL